MKKVFQLIFGDARNVVSVTASVALSWAAAQWLPAASGWVPSARPWKRTRERRHSRSGCAC